MEKPDDLLWTQLFKDKPVSQQSLKDFQANVMTEIMAHPIDFGEELRLATRRKWGLALTICLLVTGIIMSFFVTYESEAYLTMFAHEIFQKLMMFRDLQVGLRLLWGVISWPLLGVLSIYVVFYSRDVSEIKSSQQ